MRSTGIPPGQGRKRGALLPLGLTCALACLLNGGLWAQTQTTVPPPLPPPTVVPSSYIVGPGDLLLLQVLDSPELTASLRVDGDGTIHIPYSTAPLKVAGRRIDELRTVVAEALVKDQLSVNPKVDLSVTQVESHPIVVAGAVRDPVTLQAIVPIRLLDALNRAGGVAEFAGAEIEITTYTANGTPQQTTLPASRVMASDDPSVNPMLTGGTAMYPEEVRVLPGGRAYVNGGVKAPGAFPLNDTDPLTVSKAITLAGGFTSSASPQKSFLVHNVGGQPVFTPLDVRAIMKRKAPDVRLSANDMVMVGDSTTKKVGIEALKATTSALTFAAGAIIAR